MSANDAKTQPTEDFQLFHPRRYSPRESMPDYSHLDALEAQSIFILREAFNKFENMAMLWSIGKDSSVMLWLTRKAFLSHVPFPCVHVDTKFKIPEMILFRDKAAKEWNVNLVTNTNEEAIKSCNTFPDGKCTRVECCTLLKRDPLQDVIERNGFEAVVVGIRRDEEGTRAKERYFSPRDKNFEWDFRDQPPELWDQFKTDFEPGTHIRIHPLLHWTETNIWEYIDREQIPLVDIYFAPDDAPKGEEQRYRSIGCEPCTSKIDSAARTVPEIIHELKTTNIAERSTRAQDQEAEDAFEQLRAGGYM